MKSSESSLAVAWLRLSSVNVPLPPRSRTIPDLSYQLLTSHNCNSKSKSELLCNCLFTANQFVVAPSLLRPTTTAFLATEPLWSQSLCSIFADEKVGLSLMNMRGLDKCTYRIYSIGLRGYGECLLPRKRSVQ
jgi:hypothetical protein